MAHFGGGIVITIGTQVRYYLGTSPRVAFVTETRAENPDLPDDETVALCVLNPTDVQIVSRATYSATPQPGCWTLLT